MSDFINSRELFVLLTLVSQFVWLYFSGKYTINFLVEFSSSRMMGIRASAPYLVMAMLWISFFFFC